ncbi:GntR family transcriptional regulator [Demequina iriomotensis]|uniref:GntR family transcriptional regulator n=1 Tax=Demequina iriomotensis TaxID=1536641 RepID=UPI001E2F6DB8|nr:GntR family transcriptional regulator [Demequina iriomotensis]
MSKADQAYDILKHRIMDGAYGPGHRLVIDQLAREHGISSVPWRESLRRLEAEGWVDIVPNVGALVKTFDTDAFERSMRLLARLEGLATALSAAHLDADDIAEARRVNKAAADALASFDTMRFGKLNREFHELLCSRCGDDRLVDLVHHEWTRMDVIRRSAFFYAPGRALASISEHDAILDLIEGGADPEMIETAARRHEVNNLNAIKEYDRERNEAR